MRFAIRRISIDLARALTILRDKPSVPDPQALALAALGWLLGDDDRGLRFLAMTGLSADSLRNSLGEPATLAAVLDFLCAHEPDLLAAAEALGQAPPVIVGARNNLAGDSFEP